MKKPSSSKIMKHMARGMPFARAQARATQELEDELARELAAGERALKANDYRWAAAAFSRAVAIDGASSQGHSGLGRCRAAQGDLARAVYHLERALALNRTDDEARCALIRALEAQGGFGRAQRHRAELARRRPDLAEAIDEATHHRGPQPS